MSHGEGQEDMVNFLPARAGPGILQIPNPWPISLPAGRVGITKQEPWAEFLTQDF